MARVEIGEVVLGADGRPKSGASVQVNVRGGAAATVYEAATGATAKTNPLTTDGLGRIEGWLEEGSYDLVVTAGAVSYTERFEARSGTGDYDRDFGWPGVVAPMLPNAWQQFVALTAGRAYAARFVPSRDMTVDRIAFAVSTAASLDDACDVGIYNAALARIVSKGSTTGLLNSVGVKTATFTPTALTAGTTYFAAFSVVTPFAGTGASVMMDTAGYTHQLFGDAAGTRAHEFMAAHPLPATFTQNGSISNVPILAVRES